MTFMKYILSTGEKKLLKRNKEEIFVITTTYIAIIVVTSVMGKKYFEFSLFD